MENQFGKYLKSLRISRGLSLKQVENETKISSSYIHRLEKGDRSNPSALTIKALSDFYQVNEEQILRLITGYNNDYPIPINQISIENNIFDDFEVKSLLIKLLARIESLSCK